MERLKTTVCVINAVLYRQRTANEKQRPSGSVIDDDFSFFTAVKSSLRQPLPKRHLALYETVQKRLVLRLGFHLNSHRLRTTSPRKVKATTNGRSIPCSAGQSGQCWCFGRHN